MRYHCYLVQTWQPLKLDHKQKYLQDHNWLDETRGNWWKATQSYCFTSSRITHSSKILSPQSISIGNASCTKLLNNQTPVTTRCQQRGSSKGNVFNRGKHYHFNHKNCVFRKFRWIQRQTATVWIDEGMDSQRLENQFTVEKSSTLHRFLISKFLIMNSEISKFSNVSYQTFKSHRFKATVRDGHWF